MTPINPDPSNWTSYRVLTSCDTHGVQETRMMVFAGQHPSTVAHCPPICPLCEHVEPPQAMVLTYEEV